MMSPVNDKIVEQVWTSVSPILNTHRIIYFFVFCLFLSPYNNQIFNVNLMLMESSHVFNLLGETFKAIEFWKLLLAVITTIFITPFLTFYMNKYQIQNYHLAKAKILINQLEVASSLRVKDLLEDRNSGIKKINSYITIEEYLLVAVIGSIYYLYEITQPYVVISILLLVLSWTLLTYLISQRILIIFLTKIAPFNNSLN